MSQTQAEYENEEKYYYESQDSYSSEKVEDPICHHGRGSCPGFRQCVGAWEDCKPALDREEEE